MTGNCDYRHPRLAHHAFAHVVVLLFVLLGSAKGTFATGICQAAGCWGLLGTVRGSTACIKGTCERIQLDSEPAMRISGSCLRDSTAGTTSIVPLLVRPPVVFGKAEYYTLITQEFQASTLWGLRPELP